MSISLASPEVEDNSAFFIVNDHGIEGIDEPMKFNTRKKLPKITEYSDKAIKLLGEDFLDANTEIIKIRSGNRLYYEGLDHAEAMLAMQDLRQEDDRPILLVNIDFHDDMNSHMGDDLNNGNWIKYADKLNWLYRKGNSRSQVVQVRRSWPFNSRIDNYRETGIDVREVSIDGLVGTDGMSEIYAESATKACDFLKTIKRSNKYQIVVTVDLDAGKISKLERIRPPEVDLYENKALQELYKTADSVMVFHSPEYTDDDYANGQGKKFREGFLKSKI
jgi:hypothetical protein